MLLFLWEVVIPMKVKPREKLSREEPTKRRRQRDAARQGKKRQGRRRQEGPDLPSESSESADDEFIASGASRVDAPSQNIARSLAPDTVESAYVSSLICLYDDQKLAGLHNHPHPRGKAVKALMEWLRINWAAEKRRTFEDRAINGLNDGYTSSQLRTLSKMLLGGEGGFSETDPVIRLRTRLDFLFLHAMMLRGESSRNAELADLSCVELENEGPGATALMMKIVKGKTIALTDAGKYSCNTII